MSDEPGAPPPSQLAPALVPPRLEGSIVARAPAPAGEAPGV
ncbi:MAG TPA: hypothetical protein VE258_10245 [Ktedonobacterales bacterium]|nr:hypothetical protein [Ktedonobacterales bacterium]